MSDDGPIYIGGLSYSGKTQLRLLLLERPGVLITRRSYMWPRYAWRFGDLGRDENLARCLDVMIASPGIRALDPDRAGIEREFRAGSPTYARLFALFHAQHARRLGAQRWGDQLGGIEQYAAPILAADPTARIIHMVRDPRARLAELLHAGRRPGVAGWETQQWRQSMRLAVDNHEKYPRRYQVVRYEDLRGDTERIMREVWAFLGEDDVLTSRSDATLWGSEAQPAMDARLIAYVERHAAAEMTGLGYVPVRPILSQRERFLLNFIDAPINRIGLAARGFRRANDRARVERTARNRGVAVHG